LTLYPRSLDEGAARQKANSRYETRQLLSFRLFGFLGAWWGVSGQPLAPAQLQGRRVKSKFFNIVLACHQRLSSVRG